MAHLNTVAFPEGMSRGVVYGPEYDTTVIVVASGREKRNINRPRALCVGECSQAARTDDDYQELTRFFRAMQGRAHTFRLKDWSDYTCEILDGVVHGIDARHFQLCKLYFVAEGFQEIRTIQAPLADGFVLMDGDTVLTPTSHYTLDTATGIATTTSDRVAANLRWAGLFDNVVRFDTDRMATSAEAYRVFSWGQIPVREVLL